MTSDPVSLALESLEQATPASNLAKHYQRQAQVQATLAVSAQLESMDARLADLNRRLETAAGINARIAAALENLALKIDTEGTR